MGFIGSYYKCLCKCRNPYGGIDRFKLEFSEGEYTNDPYPRNKLTSSIKVSSIGNFCVDVRRKEF
jgi:hypothetical protein